MSDTINLAGKKLLVVEDDNMNYIYLSQLLRLTGGDVDRAMNGKQALELAQNNTYDVILMDIQLPDITGYEVTREIRTYNDSTPIIAQTANRNPEENDACIEAGCTDILIKPFTLPEFSRILSRYC